MHLNEIGCDGMDWNHLSQVRIHLWALLNRTENLVT